MNLIAPREVSLENSDELFEYINKISLTNSELRFPSTTSINKRFAVIFIIYNEETNSVLLLRYNTKKSHIKDEIKIDESFLDTSENAFTVAKAGIGDETGLIGLDYLVLGDQPIVWYDSDLDSDSFFHEKYPVLITKYKGVVKTPNMMPSPKNEELVWVKVPLLGIIFDMVKTIEGSEETKKHPQLQAYERFKGYHQRRPFS